MKKPFTLLGSIAALLFGLALNSSAQFQKTIDFSSSDDYANVVVQDANGGKYLVGSTTAPGGGGYDAFITKVDDTGSPLWQKQYGGANTEFGTSIMPTADGNLLLVGRSNSYTSSQDIFVVKTDLTGAVLWAKTMGTDSVDYGFKTAENNSGYLIVGQTKGAPNATNGKLDMLLVFVDFSGNVVWTKTLGTPYANEVAYDVQSMGVDGFVVAGYTGVNLIGLNDGLALIISPSGDLQGGFITGGDGDDDYRSIVAGQESVYLTGNTNAFNGGGGQDMMVAKYDGSGGVPVLKWLKKYGGSQNEFLSSAQAIPDGSGNVILLGHTTSFGVGGDALGIVIDSNGNVLTAKTWGGTGDDYISSATFGNSGAFFAGYTKSFGGAQNNIYMLSPDQTGTTPCNSNDVNITAVAMADTSIGPVLLDFVADTIVLTITNQTLTAASNTGTLVVQCEATALHEVANRLEFVLFPNPAVGSTELVLFCDKNSTATISICNYLGETLKVLSSEVVAGKNSIALDVNNFAASIYYVKVTTTDAEGVMPLSVN